MNTNQKINLTKKIIKKLQRRKFLAILLLGTLCLSVAGCTSSDNHENNDSNIISSKASNTSSLYITENTISSTVESSNTYNAYLTATTLNKQQLQSDISKYSGKRYYAYKDIKFLSEDNEWIDSPLNKDGLVEAGAIYRKLAKELKGFEMGLNDGSDYSEHLIGFQTRSSEEFKPYAENASTFFVEKDVLSAVMQKFQSLDSVNGTFNHNDKTYSFIISDLSVCAKEMEISEEALGYIFAQLTEYAPVIDFDGNSCSFYL